MILFFIRGSRHEEYSSYFVLDSPNHSGMCSVPIKIPSLHSLPLGIGSRRISIYVQLVLGCLCANGWKDPNVGGLIDDSVTGSEYVAYYHRSFAYTLSAWSFSSIDNHIANGKPVQAIQHHYKPGTGQWNHVVIISQTAHVEDSTGSYFAVSYIDPLDGNNYSKLFSAFCNETVNNDTITYIQTVYVSN